MNKVCPDNLSCVELSRLVVLTALFYCYVYSIPTIHTTMAGETTTHTIMGHSDAITDLCVCVYYIYARPEIQNIVQTTDRQLVYN